ncbi:MAG TPA: hypothetical protein DCM45_04045, partial [Clostridiales bacterium]|nr:hypothetical protein [Clostridiales bacterium]
MKANLYPGRGTWPDWNNLDVQQIGRMPAHVYRVPFPDLPSCRHAVNDNRRYVSPYILNLNNGWECRRYADILQLPESILSFRSGFDPMTVPGGIACQMPSQESKIGYPFPVTPPFVPSEMPVLVCRRTCRLPLTWGGIRKKLVLQGVSSACHIFVNGKLTGYTQGSCLPAEFDITVHLHDGDNELFIMIYPLSDGSYLEKQPMTLMSGLIRDIWIEAVSAISIDDVRVRTTPLSDEGDWQLDLDLTLISYRIAMDSPSLRVSLWRKDANIHETAWAVRLKQVEDQEYISPVQAVGRLTVRIALSGIQAWNDELPELYDLYLSVEERGGHELSCIHQPVGFRTVSCRDGRIWLNNKPVQLRSAVCPAESLTDSREMVTLLRRLRQSHLNAIYIKDYPADPILLELCDIYGVLVIDEAPLDIAHPQMLDVIREDPRWLKAAADRLERLIIRDFNHPCVVLWSAGLFRQTGQLTIQLTEKIRSLDSGRPVHLVDTGDICADLAEHTGSGYSGILDNFWLNQSPVLGQCYFVWGRQDVLMLNELRQLHHALKITAIDAVNGAFLVKNEHQWLSADNYQVDWLLLRNGRFILTGEIDNIRCGPGDEQFIELLFGDLTFEDGAEYLLRFEVTYAKSGLWADCGEEAFFQEFALTAAVRPDLEAPGQSSGRLRLESDRHHLIVSGGRFWMVFNRINGSLESWRMGDRELMAANLSPGHAQPGLQTSFWRRPDFLDLPCLLEWQQAGYDRLIPQVMTSQEGCDGHTAVIEMMILLAAAGKTASHELIVRYEIRTAGDLRIFTSIRPLAESLPKMPCFGLTMHLNRVFDQISWFGGGPGPGMASLHKSPRRGLYQGNQIDHEKGVRLPGNSPGIYPGIDWLSLKDKTGFGLSIRCGHLFGFAISPAEQPNP